MTRKSSISAILFIAIFSVSTVAASKIHRSQMARHDFVKANACPSTGVHRLPCHGYVIDHVKALACGGADDPSNMQWQTVAAAKEKDKWELSGCYRIRRSISG